MEAEGQLGVSTEYGERYGAWTPRHVRALHDDELLPHGDACGPTHYALPFDELG